MSNLGNNNTMSKNLKHYIDLSGKKRNEISEDLKIAYSTFTDWVNGNKYPRIDKIEKLANYFGIQKADLIEEHAKPEIMPATGMIPIVGAIPAGKPFVLDENIEGYLPTMLQNFKEYFYFRISGNCMIKAGINDGSMVLVHRQNTAENGDIVACRVDNDKATLKRYTRDNDIVILSPENPDSEPIAISCKQFDEGTAEILGVAKQVVSNL